MTEQFTCRNCGFTWWTGDPSKHECKFEIEEKYDQLAKQVGSIKPEDVCIEDWAARLVNSTENNTSETE